METREAQPSSVAVRCAGLCAGLLTGGDELGVDRAKLTEVVADVLVRFRVDNGQSGRTGALHPFNDAHGRLAADPSSEPEPAEFLAVPGGKCPQLGGRERGSVFRQVVET